jgi:hypothetical protein
VKNRIFHQTRAIALQQERNGENTAWLIIVTVSLGALFAATVNL